MAETTKDGIDLMRTRMARAQRVPPTPRRPAPAGSQTAPAAGGTTAPETPPAPTSGEPAAPQVRPPRAAGRTAPRVSASHRPRVGPEDPPVNLAIRVRRPLDEHLVDVIHDLRKAGVRTSKVELIEMLLWDLPAEREAVRGRLAEFRRAAPRAGDGA